VISARCFVKDIFLLHSHDWAYSIAVEQFHGMEQVGVRLPVGPQTTEESRLSGIFCVLDAAAMSRKLAGPRGGVAEIFWDDKKLSVTTKIT
jgi:hypothetical protein